MPTLARTFQVLVGDAIDWPAWPDLDSVPRRFDDIPSPASHTEAILAIGLVVQFTDRFGDYLHRGTHSFADHGCGFRAPSCSIAMSARLDEPPAWNPGHAVQRWLSDYHAAFDLAHRDNVALRARVRLQNSEPTLRVSALARELGCSVGVLQRRFLEETGDTLSVYRQRMRVAAAIALLRSSQDKVEAIALNVGWKSKKDLYRALDRFAQVSPSGVRRLSPADVNTLLARVGPRHLVARPHSGVPASVRPRAGNRL